MGGGRAFQAPPGTSASKAPEEGKAGGMRFGEGEKPGGGR